MDRRRNPFVPGAGLQPPELAGRDRLLADASIDMERVLDGRPAKGLILLGVRGVGKTVLLNRFRALADEKGFRTVRIEAPEGCSLPELLTPELRRTVYALDLRRAAGHRLRRAASVLANFAKAFKVTAGDLELSVDLAPGEGDTGHLEQDLPRLLVAMAEAAADRHTAVGLFIDEVQYLSSSSRSGAIRSGTRRPQVRSPAAWFAPRRRRWWRTSTRIDPPLLGVVFLRRPRVRDFRPNSP